jgi:hypothetical protein
MAVQQKDMTKWMAFSQTEFALVSRDVDNRGGKNILVLQYIAMPKIKHIYFRFSNSKIKYFMYIF